MIAAVLAAMTFVTPALAAGKLPAECAKVLADAQKSRQNMIMAGHMLYSGKYQNTKCGMPDYAAGIVMLIQAGDGYAAKKLLDDLMYKLNAGMPLAEKAVRELERKRIIMVRLHEFHG